MPLDVEAVYENGSLKPSSKLPLEEGQKVRISIHLVDPRAPQRPDRMIWKGSQDDLDYLILSEENDPMEIP